MALNLQLQFRSAAETRRFAFTSWDETARARDKIHARFDQRQRDWRKITASLFRHCFAGAANRGRKIFKLR
jgi:hypothetical protein